MRIEQKVYIINNNSNSNNINVNRIINSKLLLLAVIVWKKIMEWLLIVYLRVRYTTIIVIIIKIR